MSEDVRAGESDLTQKALKLATTLVMPSLFGVPWQAVTGPICMQLSVTAGWPTYPLPFCCVSRLTSAVHLRPNIELQMTSANDLQYPVQ